MKFHIAVGTLITVFLFGARCLAQTESILYAFSGGSDGGTPYSTLTLDSSGNLYGTTFNGGASGAGTVYELSPGADGWRETVLFSFDGKDGDGPYSGVIFDAEGNIYGTTAFGGAHGSGTAYELKLSTKGVWKETVLHNFGSVGKTPQGNIVFDKDGNLYGTTFYGGRYGKGTVWELSPNGKGGWVSKTLHTFGEGSDGANPYAGVIVDAEGNAYGTTWIGGANSAGVVFELVPKPSGPWKEQILYSFSGAGSVGGLIFDAKGNLYGNMFYGMVFELIPGSNHEWTETTLATVGSGAESTLVFDSGGNLYGTTLDGGSSLMGSVFELSPETGGLWNQTTLHSFTGGEDGSRADVGVTLDSKGNIYGTTYAGGGTGCGGSGCGAVFQVN
ncbi:MAG: choice-of-anchor tandem repeat GloVer-containing protein [Candidatus Sulfotelmatobacter sp.]|jgi:uncharacterized repeat protein (TIGR03803 family)